MSNKQAHVNSISIFECPRVRVVRDEPLGCLTFLFGRITINVYGEDPYKVTPELVMQTDQEAAAETNRSYVVEAREQWSREEPEQA